MKTQVKLSAGAFSLVEMLTVISVIGLIAAIAIPSIGSINGSAQTAAAKRNAQNLASVYQSGLAAGVAWGATDVPSAVAAVQTGSTNTEGVVFTVKGLDATSTTDASVNLTFNATTGLFYSPGP